MRLRSAVVFSFVEVEAVDKTATSTFLVYYHFLTKLWQLSAYGRSLIVCKYPQSRKQVLEFLCGRKSIDSAEYRDVVKSWSGTVHETCQEVCETDFHPILNQLDNLHFKQVETCVVHGIQFLFCLSRASTCFCNCWIC